MAAQSRLQAFLPGEVEDVVMETLEELVEAVLAGKPVEELKVLAATIAHHRAVSLLREWFAKKRGGGKTESLEAVQAEGGADCPDPMADSPLAALQKKELAERLSRTLSELNPPQGPILTDLFLNGLSHKEVARKHGVAIGSVGVYRKRGLETLGRIWSRRDES